MIPRLKCPLWTNRLDFERLQLPLRQPYADCWRVFKYSIRAPSGKRVIHEHYFRGELSYWESFK